MTFGSRLKVWEGEMCHCCHKDLSGECASYDDHYFCSTECLGEYLVDKLDDEIEWVNFQNKEDIDMADQERWAEY